MVPRRVSRSAAMAGRPTKTYSGAIAARDSAAIARGASEPPLVKTISKVAARTTAKYASHTPPRFHACSWGGVAGLELAEGGVAGPEPAEPGILSGRPGSASGTFSGTESSIQRSRL